MLLSLLSAKLFSNAEDAETFAEFMEWLEPDTNDVNLDGQPEFNSLRPRRLPLRPQR